MLNRKCEYITKNLGRIKIYYYKHYASLENAFVNIERNIISENVEKPKSVFHINHDSYQLTVEHHRIKKIENRVKHAIKNPAKKLWDNANMLIQHEIPIVEPVALMQQYSYGLPKNEYLISKYYEGINGDDYFCDDSPTKAHWEEAMNAIVQLTKKIKNNKFTHDYFRSSNILMVNHQPLLMGFQHVNKFEGDDKTYQIEHGYDIDFFCRYLRFSSEAQQLFEKIVGMRPCFS